jgi:Na+-transporting methylmalonyl-CoA/oxaloacetate decarboxylase gamma subunit
MTDDPDRQSAPTRNRALILLIIGATLTVLGVALVSTVAALISAGLILIAGAVAKSWAEEHQHRAALDALADTKQYIPLAWLTQPTGQDQNR